VVDLDDDDDEAPGWDALQQLGRCVFSSGQPFDDGHRMVQAVRSPATRTLV
jgi:hypothetical protein